MGKRSPLQKFPLNISLARIIEHAQCWLQTGLGNSVFLLSYFKGKGRKEGSCDEFYCNLSYLPQKAEAITAPNHVQNSMGNFRRRISNVPSIPNLGYVWGLTHLIPKNSDSVGRKWERRTAGIIPVFPWAGCSPSL